MHRRVRSSIDSDRALDVKHPTLQPDPSSTPSHPSHARSPPRNRRLDSFRETTRAKLASFSGFNKDHPDPSRGAPKPLRPGLPQRSSSLAPGHLTPPTAESSPLLDTPMEVLEVKNPTSPDTYAPSITSTHSSGSKRDRVMGLRIDQVEHGGGKVFVPQKRSDVLPFAVDHPFAAWDPTEGSKTKRRPSVSLGQMEVVQDAEEDWKVSLKGKKGWEGDTGVYRIGWERNVLDLEARVHEAMWGIDETQTFATFAEEEEPRTVLDIGTGTGLWPISQALLWPETTFIGLDIVPIQTDLKLLARAERNARSSSDGLADGEGVWEGIERRVQWDRGDFLKRLPYDAGVFDMVHIRFCGLGIPESKWGEVIEEAARVLRSGGTLEIVEMAYSLHDSTPSGIQNSFASILMAEMIQPLPVLPIRFHLPMSDLLVPLYKPILEKTWRHPVMSEAVMIWAKSALDYKGTGMKRGQMGMRALKVMREADEKWIVAEEEVNEEEEATIWVWVVKKR